MWIPVELALLGVHLLVLAWGIWLRGRCWECRRRTQHQHYVEQVADTVRHTPPELPTWNGHEEQDTGELWENRTDGILHDPQSAWYVGRNGRPVR